MLKYLRSMAGRLIGEILPKEYKRKVVSGLIFEILYTRGQSKGTCRGKRTGRVLIGYKPRFDYGKRYTSITEALV